MLAGTLWVVAGTLWVVAGCGAGATGAVPRPFAVAAADRTATGGAGVDPVGLFAISPQRKLYLECHGTGAPTVVLVPGLIAAADTWSYVTTPSATLRRSPAAVYPSVGRITRVCSYDRPGTASEDGALSPSTPVPQPTTPLGDASDLHRLLAVAGVACPCVLVGWSFGGLIARAYASTYPRSVDGLVLVDSTSEYLQTSMSPADFDVFEALVRDDDAKRIAQWSDVERFDPGHHLRPDPRPPSGAADAGGGAELGQVRSGRVRHPAAARCTGRLPEDLLACAARVAGPPGGALPGRRAHLGHPQRAQHPEQPAAPGVRLDPLGGGSGPLRHRSGRDDRP